MQILKEKSRAKSQITFDEDFNVPDAKPDAGRLIQNKGRIIMDDVRLTDGKGILTGNLQVDILYVGEERGIVSSLTAKLPFEETLNLKDIINGDKMCLKWEIETLLPPCAIGVLYRSGLVSINSVACATSAAFFTASSEISVFP